jgi:diadenosine tetraphosphate (Ap4A) HIT family hydrolase
VRCPFCARLEDPAALDRTAPLAASFPDGFPVAEGHRLVVPRRHVERIEDLDDAEFTAVLGLVREVARAAGADGVNVGWNSGAAAGQTVAHAHVHVIPRRHGDVPDPRGGVRWVLPERAAYW